MRKPLSGTAWQLSLLLAALYPLSYEEEEAHHLPSACLREETPASLGCYLHVLPMQPVMRDEGKTLPQRKCVYWKKGLIERRKKRNTACLTSSLPRNWAPLPHYLKMAFSGI